MSRNCDIDDQDVQGQVQKHERNEEIDLTLLILTLTQKKIREVTKECFEQKLPDATKYRKSEKNIMLLYFKERNFR